MEGTTTQRFRGTVMNVGDETITVSVVTYKTHSKYRKKYRTSKKYRVHVDGKSVAVGEIVSFVPCQPKSKEKRFKIV